MDNKPPLATERKSVFFAHGLTRGWMCALVVAGMVSTTYAADLPSLLPPPATGLSDLSLASTMTQTGSWASNPLLSVASTRPLFGSTTSPEFLLKDITPTSLISIDGRIDRNQFNQTNFNSTDGHSNTTLSTQNQRWSIGAVQQTDYDTTRTSEQTGFGLKPVAIRHLGLSESPQITFTPTAIDAFSLRGSLATSTYATSTYTNYQTLSVTPSYTRQVNPLNTLSLSAQAQRYLTTSNTGTRVDTLGPSIGWTAILGPRLQANASFGAQTSREIQPNNLNTDWTWQSTFAAGLAFKGEQDTINLNASRAQYPYGNGTEALQTVFNAGESHSIAPRFSVNLGGNYSTSQYPVSSSGSVKTLWGSSTGITYNVTEQLDMNATYQYRHESFIYTSQTAHDNAVTVNLTFHPKTWTLLP